MNDKLLDRLIFAANHAEDAIRLFNSGFRASEAKELITLQKRIRRSIWNAPLTSQVRLICDRCGLVWNEEWRVIRNDNDDVTCPMCGLKHYIGEENDYE
jgi:RNase P subunit RPR2